MMAMRFFIPVYKASSSPSRSQAPSSLMNTNSFAYTSPQSPMAMSIDDDASVQSAMDMSVDDNTTVRRAMTMSVDDDASVRSAMSISECADNDDENVENREQYEFDDDYDEKRQFDESASGNGNDDSIVPASPKEETTYERCMRLTAEGLVLDHLDENKGNNRLQNLEFKTVRQNTVAATGSKFRVIDPREPNIFSNYDSNVDMSEAVGRRQVQLRADQTYKVIKKATWRNVVRPILVVLRLNKEYEPLYKGDITELTPPRARQYKIWDPTDNEQPAEIVFGGPNAAASLNVQVGTLKKHLPKNINHVATLTRPPMRVFMKWKGKTRNKICIQLVM
ncbi:hypothetical protein BC940DRAFT_293215 [Gongronella butleri]|nr:hypothetical protein BC940DRAFT_293215 [Gongronella butleri]